MTALSWCIDLDTRDNVIARRNVLTALWAGRLMGLSDPDLTAYAVEVHRTDHELSGDADVIRKIVRDFGARGLSISESLVRTKLKAFHAQALVQTGGTD